MKTICVISEVDGQRYCVRKRKHIAKTADLLATVANRLTQLVDHVKDKWPRRAFVGRLIENYEPRGIQEILPTSTYCTENKGDKMAFCTTTEKKREKLIDPNTLMYVAIHELAHISSKSVGHTEEFWKNFRTLLIEAARIKIYTPVDYSVKPVIYGGGTAEH